MTAADVQPPAGLRKIAREAAALPPCRHWLDVGETKTCVDCIADAVLAALFDACTVREDPHRWLGDGSRGPRSLVLSYRLPDEPMPEPGPMPPELAEALERARAAVSSTGKEKTDGR